MTQQPDAGGSMTSVVIGAAPAGAIALPVITDLDRVDGAVDIAKVWVANTTPGTDPLYGAHVFVDALSDDSAVTSLLYLPASVGTTGAVTENVSTMISAADAAQAGADASRWYSVVPLAAAASADDQTIKVSSIMQPLIPAWVAPNSVSGPVVVLAPGFTTRTAQIAGTAAVAVQVTGDGMLRFPAQPIPGTLAGTLDGQLIELSLDSTGYESVHLNAWSSEGVLLGPAHDGAFETAVPSTTGRLSSASASFIPALLVSGLPCDVERFTARSGENFVFDLTHEPEVGSEVIFGVLSNGVTTITNLGPGQGWQFRANESSVPENLAMPGISVDRAGKRITAAGLNPDVAWCVAYVRTGLALPVDGSALSGPFGNGFVTVALDPDYELAWARFGVGGVACQISGGSAQVLKGGFPLGSFDAATGVISLPGEADGTTLDEWQAVMRKKIMPTMLRPDTLSVIGAQLPVGLDPVLLHITGVRSPGVLFDLVPDDSGIITSGVASGSYSSVTGKLNLAFSVAIETDSIEFAANTTIKTLASVDVARFNVSVYPDSGAVPVMRVGDAVVVHHTTDFGPVVVSNGQTVDVSATNLSHLWVFGEDGQEITAGFTTDLGAGHVTFINTGGYSQPVTLRRRWEDAARIGGIDGSRVSLSRRLVHDYPAGACVSSVAALGDLDAAVHACWPLATFSVPMNDAATRPGDTSFSFNSAVYPIVTTCAGAITQRWALVVLAPGVVRAVGDTVGDLGQFSMAETIAPINPATGAAYFEVPAQGWGSSWPIGAALRFNTSGAQRHLYLVRSTAPSDPSTSAGSVSLAIRGNAASE